jgi:hypothetical protein
MARQTRVPLQEPIDGHGGKVTAVVVREPTAAEYFAIGEPQVTARNPDGTIYSIENDASIDAYMDRCIVEPDPLLAKKQMGLADGIAVKAALLGFFLAARGGAPKKTAKAG